MTREQLNTFLADLDAKYPTPETRTRKPEPEPKPKERNLTDSEMQRWQAHFEQRLLEERAFIMEVVAGALAEYRDRTLDLVEAKMAAAELVRVRKETETATADLAKLRKQIDDERTKQRTIANAEITPLPLRPVPSPTLATKRA